MPSEEETVDFYLKTSDKLGQEKIEVGLFKNDQLLVDLFSWDFKIVPWPSLTFKVSLFPKIKTQGDDFEIQIFDKEERLVYKKTKVKVIEGKGAVERIANIALNKPYRLVILKPYYLPRQTYIVFKRENNQAFFEKMLPLDFNQDGKLAVSDFIALLKELSLLRLWWVR
jgi:hypothetical protein